jgi:hypothetical protein
MKPDTLMGMTRRETSKQSTRTLRVCVQSHTPVVATVITFALRAFFHEGRKVAENQANVANCDASVAELRRF